MDTAECCLAQCLSTLSTCQCLLRFYVYGVCASGWGTSSGGSKPSGSSAAQQYQRSVAPARGPFPAGCRWRAIGYKGRPAELWDVPEYEYWDEQRQQWGAQQPAACTVRGQAKTDTWDCLPPQTVHSIHVVDHTTTSTFGHLCFPHANPWCWVWGAVDTADETLLACCHLPYEYMVAATSKAKWGCAIAASRPAAMCISAVIALHAIPMQDDLEGRLATHRGQLLQQPLHVREALVSAYNQASPGLAVALKCCSCTKWLLLLDCVALEQGIHRSRAALQVQQRPLVSTR